MHFQPNGTKKMLISPEKHTVSWSTLKYEAFQLKERKTCKYWGKQDWEKDVIDAVRILTLCNMVVSLCGVTLWDVYYETNNTSYKTSLKSNRMKSRHLMRTYFRLSLLMLFPLLLSGSVHSENTSLCFQFRVKTWYLKMSFSAHCVHIILLRPRQGRTTTDLL